MSKRLAVLHTSFVFINRETMLNDLLAELLSGTEIVHFVDSEVLAEVMEAGQVTDASVRRMYHLARAAEEASTDLILSSCSSLGPAVDAISPLIRVPIIKIDEAMAETAARKAEQIGVLATVATTLAPTSQLIRDKAADLEKGVQVTPRLAEGAFQALMSGERQRHDAMVKEAAADLARGVDILVLAQASMTRLAPELTEETGLEVLSSPRLGIEHVRRALQ